MRSRSRLPRRGRRIPPPAWGCGEPSCPRYRWQPVSAMGEYDDLDAAMADLDGHYARCHPEFAQQEEVIGGGYADAA